MSHSTLVQLAGIVILGVTAQWVAWRVKLPSILLLLVVGVLAGPVTGWLQPDQLFGNLMLPGVSLSVAVVLYEGGLNLKLRELKHIGSVFFRLTTIGAAVTWIVGSLSARFILQFAWPISALLGAILVVTGPTVIGPILRHLRLRGKVGSLLKWEGIIIDPIGATLAVLIFTVVSVGATRQGIQIAAVSLILTLIVGVLVGALSALLLILALKKFWIPDSLHNLVSLVLMFLALIGANAIQPESGLLAVTVMGIVLANQRWVSIHHVLAFKETLTTLLISCLFIVLSAQLKLSELSSLGWRSVAFLGVMIFVARPLSVLLATIPSTLSWSERLFLCCMAPRGIVAAAISSVIALSLVEAGYSDAVQMVPITFLVVFATVLLYGVGAIPIARWLGITQPNPQGVLFIGAEDWGRQIAAALQQEGCQVCLVDTDWEHIGLARMANLPCVYGSALVESTRDQIDFAGLARMLALTSNNEVNSLACLRYTEDFGRSEVYQLTIPEAKKGLHEQIPLQHRGRLLFGPHITFDQLRRIVADGYSVKKTKLSNEFGYADFQKQHGDDAVLLFVIKPNGALHVWTTDDKYEPKPADTIISLAQSRA